MYIRKAEFSARDVTGNQFLWLEDDNTVNNFVSLV